MKNKNSVKPQTAYTIKYADGTLSLNSMSYSKQECINNFVGIGEMTWKEYRKYGVRCVKVALHEI